MILARSILRDLDMSMQKRVNKRLLSRNLRMILMNFFAAEECVATCARHGLVSLVFLDAPVASRISQSCRGRFLDVSRGMCDLPLSAIMASCGYGTCARRQESASEHSMVQPSTG